MNMITRLIGESIVEAIGWTILHSFWQGLLIAFLLTISLLIFRRKSPQLRYLAGLGAMILLMTAVVVTFFQVYDPAVSVHSVIDVEPMEELVAETVVATGFWEDFSAYFDRQLPLIVAIWLLGVLILTLRMLGELAYIQHLKYQRIRLVAPEWEARMRAIAKKMAVKGVVKIRESLQIGTPMVVGFIKPVILVPVGLLTNLSVEQVEQVLAHELAHIRRHDYLINILQSLMEAILFFNPAVWWISSMIRTEREHCCDDAAINYTQDEVAYVQTLATLEEWRETHGKFALAFQGRRGGVLGRIRRILDGDRPAQLSLKIFWSTAILLVCLGATVVNLSSQPVEQADLSMISTEDLPALEEGSSIQEIDPAVFEEMPVPEPEIRPAAMPLTPSAEPASSYEQEEEETSEAEIPIVTSDTLPEEAIVLQKKIRELRKEYREKQMEARQVMLEIRKKALEAEQGAHKMANQKQLQAMEIRREMNKIEEEAQQRRYDQQLLANKIKMETLELETQHKQLELEYRQLEMDEGNEGENKTRRQELIKKEREIQEAIIQKEKKMQQIELQVEREMLEIQQKARQLESKIKDEENNGEMERRKLELEENAVQQEMQKIQMELDMLNKEYQLKIEELEIQLNEVMERANR